MMALSGVRSSWAHLGQEQRLGPIRCLCFKARLVCFLARGGQLVGLYRKAVACVPQLQLALLALGNVAAQADEADVGQAVFPHQMPPAAGILLERLWRGVVQPLEPPLQISLRIRSGQRIDDDSRLFHAEPDDFKEMAPLQLVEWWHVGEKFTIGVVEERQAVVDVINDNGFRQVIDRHAQEIIDTEWRR